MWTKYTIQKSLLAPWTQTSLDFWIETSHKENSLLNVDWWFLHSLKKLLMTWSCCHYHKKTLDFEESFKPCLQVNDAVIHIFGTTHKTWLSVWKSNILCWTFWQSQSVGGSTFWTNVCATQHPSSSGGWNIRKYMPQQKDLIS